MEWWLALAIIIAGLVVVMASGMPVAFAFLSLNIVGAYFLWGGTAGLYQLAFYVLDSVTRFHFLPVVMFILMGELMFHSGIGFLMMDAVDKWIGRLPGRLGLVAVGSGTLFATLSGSGMATTAMLGSVLTPEMEKRGYKKPMSIGSVMGSGGLAMIIPPSGIAVLLASLGDFSIGKMLIAGIIPGLLIAFLYGSYIVIRCYLQPSIAPSYEMAKTPLTEKLVYTATYVLPLSLVIFLVLGLIFLGIATPSEAAATGALGAFILTVVYRKLNWGMLKKSFLGTFQVTIMVLTIVTGADAFSRILVFSGASRGLTEFALSLDLAPIMLLLAMLVVVLFLGCFMDLVAILMITLPMFMPIIQALDINPVWFGLLMLIALEMSGTTPPFGMMLYVMKGVAPPDTTFGDIVKAGLPFLACDSTAMVLVMIFPALALWLPALMLG